MQLEDLNHLANDLLVARLTINDLKQEEEDIMLNHPRLKEIRLLKEELERDRDAVQKALVESMAGLKLKSWKTELASFSRAKRVYMTPNPAWRKQMENLVKEDPGALPVGWDYKETEYLSIRTVK